MFFELPYLWHTPWYAGPDFRHLMPVSTSLGVVYFLVIDALCCPPTALEIPVDVITGIVSIPIFVDSAFVVLYPVAKALAKNSKRSLLTLGVALAGGLVVTHHTVPPTPGPLGVAGIFGVDLGAMLLSGMCFAVPCVIGMVYYAKWLDKRFPEFNQQAFSEDELRDKLDGYIEKQQAKSLPSLFLSMLPIVLPIVLIFAKAIVLISSANTASRLKKP